MQRCVTTDHFDNYYVISYKYGDFIAFSLHFAPDVCVWSHSPGAKINGFKKRERRKIKCEYIVRDRDVWWWASVAWNKAESRVAWKIIYREKENGMKRGKLSGQK